MSEIHPITPERRELFLSELARTGSESEAAAAATPWKHGGDRPGRGGFRNLIARDPEFKAAVEDAKAQALGRVEAEIMRRAVDGVDEPVFQGGALVGHKRNFSDTLILALARRLSAEWRDKSSMQISGSAGVLVVGSVAATMDEWNKRVAEEEEAQRAASKLGDPPALPTP